MSFVSFFRLLFKRRYSLPVPSLPAVKPLTVGYCDVLLSDIAVLLPPAPELFERSLLVRLYYPSHQENDETTHPFFFFGSLAYIEGVCHYMGISKHLARIFSFLFSGVKLPANELAPISSSHATPTIIFSHGLCGTRAMYTSLLSHLVTHGFLVAAIEHGDGSACFSDRVGRGVQYRRIAEGPANLRQLQLEHRCHEVAATRALLERLNTGELALADVLHPAHRAKAADVAWTFAGQLDLAPRVLVGHSFGGATAIQASTLQAGWHAVVAFDPWMEPLPKDVLALRADAPAPTPCLLTESDQFADMPSNARAISDFLSLSRSPVPAPVPAADDSKPGPPPGRAEGGSIHSAGLRLIGTRHQDCSDMPALLGAELAKKFKVGGEHAADVTIATHLHAALAFLSHHRLYGGPEAHDLRDLLNDTDPLIRACEVKAESAAQGA